MPRITPDDFAAWSRVIRDALTYCLGMGIILYELLATSVPNTVWVGTGVGFLCAAPALRIGERWNRDE